MAEHRVLRVILPADWKEIPGQTPRQFERDVKGAGLLQVSLRPPQPELAAEPERLLPWLQEFIADSTLDLDGAVHEFTMECAAGPCAFSLRKSKRFGLVGIWAIAGELFISATFVMGSFNAFEDELEDAIGIMQAAYFEEGDGSLTP